MFPYAIIAAVVIGAAVAGAIYLDAGQRTARARQDEADDLEAARRRLVAAGEDPDAALVGTVGTGVYTSRHAVDTRPTDEPVDRRTQILIVDPTLSRAEITSIVEHVEPGAGSMASFAATACDTREMRTSAEQRELEAVYEAAHAENTERDLNTAVAGIWDTADDVWAVIDAWVEKYHGKEHYANCVHCAEVHDAHSDEYEQIVTDRVNTDTGEISMAALLAVRPRQDAGARA